MNTFVSQLAQVTKILPYNNRETNAVFLQLLDSNENYIHVNNPDSSSKIAFSKRLCREFRIRTVLINTIKLSINRDWNLGHCVSR